PLAPELGAARPVAHPYLEAVVRRAESHPERAHPLDAERRPRLLRHARLQQPEGARPVERPRVQASEAQRPGHGTGGRRLAGPGGAVERDDGALRLARDARSREGIVTVAPGGLVAVAREGLVARREGLAHRAGAPGAPPASASQKPGKLTAAAPGSSISMACGPDAASTPNDIAMR